MSTKTKSPADLKGENKKFSQKLEDFLRAKRMALIIAAIVLVAAVAVLAVVSGIRSSQLQASTLKIEQLTEDVSSWAAITDQASKTEAEKKLVANLNDVTKKWPHQFAAARAYSLLASIAESNKDWAGAENDWMAIYQHFPKTYLAPIALQNAAAAAEERGAPDAAIAHYQVLVDKYVGKTVGIPHALFTIGRLNEASKDYTAAISSYEKLLSLYADDDWTKLAKDRIIFLKAGGFAK